MMGIGGYTHPCTRGNHLPIPIIPLFPFSKMVNGKTTHAFRRSPGRKIFLSPIFLSFPCFVCFSCGLGPRQVLSALCVSIPRPGPAP